MRLRRGRRPLLPKVEAALAIQGGAEQYVRVLSNQGATSDQILAAIERASGIRVSKRTFWSWRRDWGGASDAPSDEAARA